jgi:peptidoglycan DL-endopeptidase LytF
MYNAQPEIKIQRMMNMNLFTRHRLEKEKDGYVVILYMDSHLTEFADELGHLRSERSGDLYQLVQDFVLRKFPDIKVKAVRVVLGSMVLANFPITNLYFREKETDE